jgi:tRNA pseudouridine synthase 10
MVELLLPDVSLPEAIFLQARYRKFVRNISQTRWDCRKCMGKRILSNGQVCDHCGGTDKFYRDSVEDLICIPIQNRFGASATIFHAAGREDVDVRCLGNGRPFVIEITQPQKWITDLAELTEFVNEKGRKMVEISLLRFASRLDVGGIKQETAYDRKTYQALVYCYQPLNQVDFNSMLDKIRSNLTDVIIQQRTPHRVTHRKLDKVREKRVHQLSGRFIDPVHFFFEITTQGGTYIKELITGDKGYTTPSFVGITEIPMVCVELDVIKIEMLKKHNKED